MNKVLFVYSDASTEDSLGTAVSIISTKESVVGTIAKKYKADGPSATEVCGILQSLEFIRQNRYTDYDIEIYTDLESSVDTFARLKSGEEVPDLVYNKLWERIIELSEGLNITMYHYDAHQVGTNPNVVCDILADIIRKRG